MAYRINYRAAQGQQGAGTPGGGVLLDQIQHNFRIIASGASWSEAVAILPSMDTTDAAVSILGDYNPSSFAPVYRVVRAALALSVSQASGTASTSAPLVQLVRNRSEPASAPTSVSAAIIATFDFSAVSGTGASLAYGVWSRSGSLVSNGTLNPGDVLTLNNTPVSQTMSVPAGVLTVDIEG